MARKAAKSSVETSESSGFRGIGSHALGFLTALKANNDRNWFAANKEIFQEQLDGPFRELVLEVATRLAARKIDLAPNPKSPIFRIHRDVRFSKDKSPYKTNMGAALHPGGDKSRPGLLYIHIDPGECFLAAGFYQPEPPTLKALRQAIADDPRGFATVLRKLEARQLAPSPGDPLSRIPKGFEAFAGSPHEEFLRKRSFIISRPVADAELEDPAFPETVAQFAHDALPWLAYFQAKLEAE
jgi:uncharacterized protein (TIGR02453 family)